MPIPERIPLHLDDYRLDCLGRYRNGQQFMAMVTASIPHGNTPNFDAHKRWYAVLHRFSADGTHMSTDAWFAGTTADGERRAVERAEQKLQELLSALGPYELCNIEVRPFRTEIDGRTFGLIAGYYDDEQVELVPSGLAFYEPWDGRYDT
ncbi:MAG: hypothetical protein JWN24_1965 [Phycisphaerales bacterium]|nr:hypothetical protein [Phycisphaerales bacterium]